MEQNNRHRRIGIIGGMGPMAGVRLQELIVERTLATCDQEHLEVVCLTNPHIPDRTASLARDGGDAFVAAIRQSIADLARMDVDVVAIPCHTAHARFNDIARGAPAPIMNLVALTTRAVVDRVGSHGRVALFATEGTVRSGVYQQCAPAIDWITPSTDDQREITRIIGETKAGRRVPVRAFDMLIASAIARGADIVVLACTELSLYASSIRFRARVIDPLELLADALIAFGSSTETENPMEHTHRAKEVCAAVGSRTPPAPLSTDRRAVTRNV